MDESQVILRHSFLLKQLADAPDRTLAKFNATKASPKALALDKAAIDAVVAVLESGGYVSVKKDGKARNVTLLDTGESYLARLPVFSTTSPKSKAKPKPPAPPPPPAPPELRPFVLLKLFVEKDNPVPRSKIFTPAEGKKYGFQKEMLAPLLQTMADEGVVIEEGPPAGADTKVFYQITQRGRKELARGGQPRTVDVTLSGADFNELLGYASGLGGDGGSAKAPREAESGRNDANALSSRIQSSFSDDALIAEAKNLMRSLGRTELLPIYELRSCIRQKYGERAASHEELDPRLRNLRGKRLRLISIDDRSRAKPEQLRDGVQGVDELFFYIGDLR